MIKKRLSFLSLFCQMILLVIFNIPNIIAAPQLQVTLNIIDTCSIAIKNIDFGSITNNNIEGRATDGLTTASIKCSPNIKFYLGIDGADSEGNRYMRSDTDKLIYRLTSDSNHNELWPNVKDSINLTAYKTDNNGNNSITIYGQIPVQENIPAGIYSGIVNVTLTIAS